MSKLAILLTVAFVVLKLCGVISWSWLACFLPVIALALVVVAVVAAPIIFLAFAGRS